MAVCAVEKNASRQKCNQEGTGPAPESSAFNFVLTPRCACTVPVPRGCTGTHDTLHTIVHSQSSVERSHSHLMNQILRKSDDPSTTSHAGRQGNIQSRSQTGSAGTLDCVPIASRTEINVDTKVRQCTYKLCVVQQSLVLLRAHFKSAASSPHPGAVEVCRSCKTVRCSSLPGGQCPS